jgi:phosphoribosylcarboxyaminoimidazole (NCAIR) mutase
MHPGFRFPRSTVVLMCVILAGVVLAIDKAKTIVQMKSGVPHASLAVWDAMLSTILLALLLVVAAVGTVWGILFALHRTGMQRLQNVQTWPEHR